MGTIRGPSTYTMDMAPKTLIDGQTRSRSTFGPATQKGRCFEHVGSSPMIATFDLTVFDYGNPGRLDVSSAPSTAAQVRAYSEDTSVQGGTTR